MRFWRIAVIVLFLLIVLHQALFAEDLPVVDIDAGYTEAQKDAAIRAYRVAHGFLSFPLSSYREPSAWFHSYRTSAGQFHGGTDYPCRDEEIRASADGTVTKVIDGMGNTYPDRYTYGNVIYLLHSHGLMTIYGHLKSGSIVVKENQTVKKGQKLAISGNSGYSSGPHLHFEVTVDGNRYSKGIPVDPYYCQLWNSNPPTPATYNGPGEFGQIPDEEYLDDAEFRICKIEPKGDKIDCDSLIKLYFSQPVDLKTVNKFTVLLEPLRVFDYCLVSANEKQTVVTLSGFLFLPHKKYTVKVLRDIKNQKGEPLLNPGSTSFTTGNWPHPRWPEMRVEAGTFKDINRQRPATVFNKNANEYIQIWGSIFNPPDGAFVEIRVCSPRLQPFSLTKGFYYNSGGCGVIGFVEINAKDNPRGSYTLEIYVNHHRKRVHKFYIR